MKPLEEALLYQQALRQRRTPSVMNQQSAPQWQPEYEKEPPLEQVSPEDFIPNPKTVIAALKGLGPMIGAIRYHGSRSATPFDVFNTSSKSVNSTTFGDIDTVRHGAFLSDNPKFAEQFGTVSKWDVKPKNTAVIDDNIKGQFIDSLDPFGVDRDVWLQARHSKQPWGFFENDLGKKFTEWLALKGYDSARFKEYVNSPLGKEVGGKTTVIFNPDIAKKIGIEP